ncbi:hypothetical protein EJ08DRAFT_699526 [Tothia fuscella]|uniref:Uncharacterized protein n=1 Tax=Tothia fuscella TaxID=1048955 RepID=A0A9P4NMA1_9PEZI|nr:hypothetical protein EJ08DRAFT_699526 [Tothia fuscella]
MAEQALPTSFLISYLETQLELQVQRLGELEQSLRATNDNNHLTRRGIEHVPIDIQVTSDRALDRMASSDYKREIERAESLARQANLDVISAQRSIEELKQELSERARRARFQESGIEEDGEEDGEKEGVKGVEQKGMPEGRRKVVRGRRW